MKTSEVLEAAKSLIDTPDKWTTNGWGDGWKWSFEGAIAHATGLKIYENGGMEVPENSNHPFYSARHCAYKASLGTMSDLITVSPESAIDHAIDSWPGVTHEIVLNTCDKAISLALQEEA